MARLLLQRAELERAGSPQVLQIAVEVVPWPAVAEAVGRPGQRPQAVEAAAVGAGPLVVGAEPLVQSTQARLKVAVG